MKDFIKNDISIPEDVEVTEPLRLYVREMRQIPVLSMEEELALGKQMAAGDMDAKRKLEEANLRLVFSVAKHYAGQGMQFMDLVQEGNIGLMQAVEKFECPQDTCFSEYAIPWIEEAIESALKEQSEDIQVPAHVAESMQKVQKAARKLQQELGREAAFGEIAEFLGDKTAEEVGHIMAMLRDPVRIQDQAKDEADAGFGDSSEKEENVQEEALNSLIRKEEVAQLLEHLNEEEQKIIRLRFGLEDGKAHTYEETGEALHMTGEQIRQTEQRAMGKLREAAGRNG